MTIWEYSRTVSRRLLMWNLINILSGMWILRSRGIARGIGGQAVGWGIINIGIAVFGTRATENRQHNLENPLDAKIIRRESRNLRLILWVNAGLDLLYILGGWNLEKRLVRPNATMPKGSGYGIIIQGMLLFVFDVIHALRLPKYPQDL